MTCDLTAFLSVPAVEKEFEILKLPVIGKGRCDCSVVVLLLWEVLFLEKCLVLCFVMFLRVCGKVSALIVLLYNFHKTKTILKISFSCFIFDAVFLCVGINK